MATVLKASFAAESGHWYQPDGTPAYEIVGANGKLRSTTLRDARKLGLFPSVTTILRMAAAPGLTRYFEEQERKATIRLVVERLFQMKLDSYDSPELLIDILDVPEFHEKCHDLAGDRASKARERGTEIHAAIEQRVRGELVDEALIPFADAALSAVTEWAGPQKWEAERSFCSPDWGFGGKLDLSSKDFIADFKTTDKELSGIKTWPDHRRQLAAYRVGLQGHQRCAIVYVSSVKPEAVVLEIDAEELRRGWMEFMYLLLFWKQSNKVEHAPTLSAA